MSSLESIKNRHTIVALSTPAGASALAIVRLSGDRAWELVRTLIPPELRAPLPARCANYVALQTMVQPSTSRVPIPVELYLMRRPASYTREDVVEIHMPGVPPLMEQVVESLLAAGARMAEPGEFTRRAFLNGRIDLAQAEAVCALIRARSEAHHRAALRQLQGTLSSRVRKIREEILALCAHVEVSIDFSDQDIEIISPLQIAEKIEQIRASLVEMCHEGSAGGIAQETVRVVLCGPPNAGKSTLFNALLGAEHAIVTPIPGTTRDTLEGDLSIEGVTFRLVDTAGLGGNPCHELDVAAQERALREIEESDLVLLVLDSSQPLREEEAQWIRPLDPKRSLIILNKSDLPQRLAESKIAALWREATVLHLSALHKTGLDLLRARLAEMVLEGRLDRSESAFMLNARHKEALRQANIALQYAHDSARQSLSPELIALDLREALDALGEIVGETTTEEILDRIFSQFCIGK